jgi:hypothetical protein
VSLNQRPILAGMIILIMLTAVFGELGSGTLGQVAQNTAHVPAFALIAWLAFRWLQQSRPLALMTLETYIAAFSIAVALGILVEVIQAFTGRDAEIRDVVHDAFGAATTLSLLIAWQCLQASKTSAALLAFSISLIALAVGTYEFVWASASWLKREYQFPVLIQFDSQLDAFFLSAKDTSLSIVAVPKKLATIAGEKALLISLSAGEWPGVDDEDLHADWTKYRVLSLEAINPTARPIELSIRVHDTAHNLTFRDRFTRTYTLSALERRIIDIPLTEIESAPYGRKMLMDHISGLIIFSAGAQPDASVYLKTLWLH